MRTGRQFFVFYLKIACVAVFSLGIGCCAYSSTVPNRETARLTRKVKADLPLGTSHARVLAWCMQHRIEHDGYEVCHTISGPSGVYPCQGPGLIDCDLQSGSGFWPFGYTGDMELCFYFDRQGNLCHYGCWPIAADSL